MRNLNQDMRNLSQDMRNLNQEMRNLNQEMRNLNQDMNCDGFKNWKDLFDRIPFKEKGITGITDSKWFGCRCKGSFVVGTRGTKYLTTTSTVVLVFL